MPDLHATPMTPVDRAWLEMDSPRNPMVVNAIIEFDGPVDAEALRSAMLERMLRYPRFRQRVENHRTSPRWVDDSGFNPDYHVHVIPLQRSRPDADIRAAIEAQVNKPLDRALPLWRLFVYARHDHGATVLFRAHHAMADGVALVQMLMQCTDEELAAHPHRSLAHGVHAPRRGPFGGLIDRLESLNVAATRVADFLRDDLQHPQWIPGQLREVRRMLATVGHVLRLPEDNPPALRKPLSGHRSVAWTTGIPFEPMHELAQAEGVSVNDVFLAAVAGAFTRYLVEHGASVKPADPLRVSVPVNLRPRGFGTLGNCFGLVLVDLPLGHADWRERLALVTQRMDELKRTHAARTLLIALAAAGRLPVVLEKGLVNRVAAKSVAVVSNLRGPEAPMTFAGSRMRELIFWPPQAGGIGIGVSLFSYDGRLSIGVTADRALIAYPERLIEAFEDEVKAMLAPGKAAAATRRPHAATRTPRKTGEPVH